MGKESHQESAVVVLCLGPTVCMKKTEENHKYFWTASGLAAYQTCNNAL
jgi:hypothetical protein